MERGEREHASKPAVNVSKMPLLATVGRGNHVKLSDETGLVPRLRDGARGRSGILPSRLPDPCHQQRA